MTEHTLFQARQQVLGGTYRTFYSTPLVVESAFGCVISDADGNDYLDAYNNVPVIGHSSPKIRAAVDRQLGKSNVHTRYVDATVVDYAERLVSCFPPHLESVVFACSGSEANDLALRLAAHETGKNGVIVTRHAYHGTTSAVAAISPSLVGVDGVADHVELIDLPDWNDKQFDAALATAIRLGCRRLEERGHPCGAFVLDSAMTSDGIIEPRPLVEANNAVIEAGAFYIADEVQSGFGRTGSAWGFEQLEVQPDLVTLGKPMANGLPLSAIVGRSETFARFGNAQRYFNTFAGTAVSIAAAEVVLTALTDGELADRANGGGALFKELLEDVVAGSGVSASIRQNGLMVGVDFHAGCSEDVAARRAAYMVERLYAERILVSSTGHLGTVVKIRPPLVITNGQLKSLAQGIDRAMRSLEEFERGHSG